MKLDNAYIPAGFVWSSPFVRWQGSLADVSSVDLGVTVTADALAARGFDPKRLTQLVVGMTIPQLDSFYAVPWMAARLGADHITGPLIAQACATSVASLVAAASSVAADGDETVLVVATDRTSNGPLLIYPNTAGAGGAPTTEHWVLDNFACDPWTGSAMVVTAENVAAEAGFSRQSLDDVTLLRYEQYQKGMANDRAFQRRYMQPVVPRGKKGVAKEFAADEGIHPYTKESLASLKPMSPTGVVTFGTQTHPADGCAGALVCNKNTALELSGGKGIVRLVSAAFSRTDKARMPKAATTAAQKAVADAGLKFSDIKLATTHNPFAVNDLWFCKETGFAPERMNPYGCSLIFGHPQGPTGLRSIAELIEALREAGGGYGLFTGCAAGDTGAAIVISVEA